MLAHRHVVYVLHVFHKAKRGIATPKKELDLIRAPLKLAEQEHKGADAGAATLLRSSAPQADCDLHLALLSIEENGSAQYNGSYRRRYQGYDDDDDSDECEVVEVYDRWERLTEWRRPDRGGEAAEGRASTTCWRSCTASFNEAAAVRPRKGQKFVNTAYQLDLLQ